MSRLFSAEIANSRHLCEDIFELEIKADTEDIIPGQFFNLYLNDEAHLLPRPISVCDAKNGILKFVFRKVGYGTKVFSELSGGTVLRLLGPLGNGYPIESLNKEKRILLAGGGLGVPPMLLAARILAARGMSFEIVLGFRDEGFLLEEFEAVKASVHLVSDTGRIGEKGNVIDCINHKELHPDTVFACGPKPMLSALKNYTQEKGINLFVSLEERMACGVGACLACVCETAEMDEHSMVHNKRVCKDGPVFDAKEVVL